MYTYFDLCVYLFLSSIFLPHFAFIFNRVSFQVFYFLHLHVFCVLSFHISCFIAFFCCRSFAVCYHLTFIQCCQTVCDITAQCCVKALNCCGLLGRSLVLLKRSWSTQSADRCASLCSTQFLASAHGSTLNVTLSSASARGPHQLDSRGILPLHHNKYVLHTVRETRMESHSRQTSCSVMLPIVPLFVRWSTPWKGHRNMPHLVTIPNESAWRAIYTRTLLLGSVMSSSADLLHTSLLEKRHGLRCPAMQICSPTTLQK